PGRVPRGAGEDAWVRPTDDRELLGPLVRALARDVEPRLAGLDRVRPGARLDDVEERALGPDVGMGDAAGTHRGRDVDHARDAVGRERARHPARRGDVLEGLGDLLAAGPDGPPLEVLEVLAIEL